MKTYTFDVSVDAWIQNISIDADSEDEAMDKLNSMSLEDLVSSGYVKDFAVSDVDMEVEYDEDEFVEDLDDEDLYEDSAQKPKYLLEFGVDNSLKWCSSAVECVDEGIISEESIYFDHVPTESEVEELCRSITNDIGREFNEVNDPHDPYNYYEGEVDLWFYNFKILDLSSEDANYVKLNYPTQVFTFLAE